MLIRTMLSIAPGMYWNLTCLFTVCFHFSWKKLEGVGYSSHVFSFEDTIFWSLHCAVQTQFRSIIPLAQGKNVWATNSSAFDWMCTGYWCSIKTYIFFFWMNLFLFSRDQNVMGIKSKRSFWNLLNKVRGMDVLCCIFVPWPQMQFVSSPRSW